MTSDDEDRNVAREETKRNEGSRIMLNRGPSACAKCGRTSESRFCVGCGARKLVAVGAACLVAVAAVPAPASALRHGTVKHPLRHG